MLIVSIFGQSLRGGFDCTQTPLQTSYLHAPLQCNILSCPLLCPATFNNIFPIFTPTALIRADSPLARRIYTAIKLSEYREQIHSLCRMLWRNLLFWLIILNKQRHNGARSHEFQLGAMRVSTPSLF